MEEIRGRRAMLSFPQMATKAQITAEQYLHMTFEHDAEFVRGEIVERSMPDNFIHVSSSDADGDRTSDPIHPLFPCPELRLRLEPELTAFRTSRFSPEPPKQSVPSTPPLLVIEILSKDDRHHDLMEKLEEYRVWGVPNIWVVDPLAKRFATYTELGLQNVSSLALADYPFELTPSILFSDL